MPMPTKGTTSSDELSVDPPSGAGEGGDSIVDEIDDRAGTAVDLLGHLLSPVLDR
ncbi:hypothetical protein [Antrihabitans stalactiti]|uniref:hypothetical protein n=1 Tax=Antrihabitans stalactiti TaxID=2584121 RepID=UPI00146E1AE1|nr:hypothetical protein [Antrihabitans stalactiti]